MAGDRQAKRKERPGPVWVRVALACACAFSILPAFAQKPVTGFSGIGKQNSKQPIEIESDRLEVDDKRHMAIFTGNVSATQGDYNLKASRLEVTYETASKARAAPGSKPVKPVKAADAGAAGDPISSGQIKLIHANGGEVVVTSKKDQQKVTGEDAVYDVQGQKITMTGKKVILSQNTSVVKGEKLVIDLATGRANFDTGEGREGREGRVIAKFDVDPSQGGIAGFSTPKKKEEAAPSPPAARSSGWQTKSGR